MSLPPIDFLLNASTQSLEDLELASRNRASNLAKAVKVEIDDWIEQEATALFARWMRENRDVLLSGRTIGAEPHKAGLFLDKGRKAG